MGLVLGRGAVNDLPFATVFGDFVRLAQDCVEAFALKQYPAAPFVSFQRVPEPKVVKNRVHMDIVVDDIEIATSRIVELGGRRRRPDADFDEYGFCWRTMADPEGNEFCLIYKCK